LDVELVLDELDVPAGCAGQVVGRLDGVERLPPAGQALVHRPAVVEVALVRRELRRLAAVAQTVASAHRHLVEGGQHVELRERQRRDAVEAHRVPKGDEVEPAATPLPAGHGPVLGAELAHPVVVGALDLGRERPFADARHVGLRDADDGVDARRADPDPRRGRTGDGVRGGHERIRPVVEVEERPLRALEEDVLPRVQGAVDEERGVGDVRPQPLRMLLRPAGDRLELDRLGAVDPLEPDVPLCERDLDLLAQDLRVEQVLDADPDPGGLVRVGRADPAASRADLEPPEPPLARLVDGDVPGHDQMRVPGQANARRRDPALLELVELGHELLRVDHAAGADHALLARHDPRREVPELEGLPLDLDRVAGVRPALVAADEVRLLGEQVDDLALALVTPLRPDDDGRGHARSLPAATAGPPARVSTWTSPSHLGWLFARGQRGRTMPAWTTRPTGATTSTSCSAAGGSTTASSPTSSIRTAPTGPSSTPSARPGRWSAASATSTPSWRRRCRRTAAAMRGWRSACSTRALGCGGSGGPRRAGPASSTHRSRAASTGPTTASSPATISSTGGRSGCGSSGASSRPCKRPGSRRSPSTPAARGSRTGGWTSAAPDPRHASTARRSLRPRRAPRRGPQPRAAAASRGARPGGARSGGRGSGGLGST